MHTRIDRQTAVLVDLAINFARSHGVAAGANVLFHHGVSLEVAQRVLLRPSERRGIAIPRTLASPTIPRYA
jgi:hypothetical protein